ncbi:type II toxin-antitoxin system HipA family toxin [Paraburkholderia dinghuensis]|uniref:Type II toxin-antitoxin system HipA family toxin n=1 Tax=Paraburkholderia dinghuensis TaxID=2305225 RepID=A0A3N6MYN2_9BURK|nr:type II toxin-antitoxin system HipA family toxin [Paraburkholderia dinghuensis]RQH07145.1 type II toxin-antitoxin system HipA family toxin [Paraburkholderia dinghuensis]
MGRKSHSRALSIWANGEHVGTWAVTPTGDMELRYDAAWKQSAAGRPLSLSLPFGVGDRPLRGERVHNYFDNLLPDSPQIRRRIATRFSTETVEAFDLLKAIGRDCVGAVQLLGEDESPENVGAIEGTPLTDAAIERLLLETSGAVSGVGETGDELRISLAGAQEKTALLFHDGRWCLPHGATPTTHILKLPLGLIGHRKVDFQTSVENEWLCLAVLKAYGLPVSSAQILRFGEQKVLCVERFDRAWSRTGALLRLPQEDFCQALGVPPHRKYESQGGPGMREIADILRQSQRPQEDIETFLGAQIAFWMLAAPDGHAKNFSIRLLPGGRFQLAPLYDVMSIWPVEGDGGNQWSWHKATLAMAVWGRARHYRMRDVKRAHFDATAQLCHYGREAGPLIERFAGRTPEVIERVASSLPAGFPERIAERLFDGLRLSAQRLAAG